jgi:hypothetical protein
MASAYPGVIRWSHSRLTAATDEELVQVGRDVARVAFLVPLLKNSPASPTAAPP